MSPPCIVVWQRVHLTPLAACYQCAPTRSGEKGVEPFIPPETTQKLMKAFATWSSMGDALYCARLPQGHQLGTSQTRRSLAPSLYGCWWESGRAGGRAGGSPSCRRRRGRAPLLREPLPGPHHPLPAALPRARSRRSCHRSRPSRIGKTPARLVQSAAQTLTAPAEMPPLEALLILMNGRRPKCQCLLLCCSFAQGRSACGRCSAGPDCSADSYGITGNPLLFSLGWMPCSQQDVPPALPKIHAKCCPLVALTSLI